MTKSIYPLLITVSNGENIYDIVAQFPMYTLAITCLPLLKHTWRLETGHFGNRDFNCNDSYRSLQVP